MTEDLATMNTSNYSRELSYNALKSVLKHTSFERREQIYWLIPSCRTVNSFIAYQFGSVHIAENHLKVDEREWDLGPENGIDMGADADQDINESNQNQEKTSINFRCTGYFYMHTIDKGYRASFKKLLDEYLRGGTEIERLTVFRVPDCLKERDSKLAKLKVTELKLKDDSYAAFQDCLSFIDPKSLKKIHFCVREQTLPLLQDPVVRSTKGLFLQFPYYDPIPFNVVMQEVLNQQVHVVYFRLPIEQFEELANSWIQSRRPIESSFMLTVEDFTYILDVFDRLLQKKEAVATKVGKFRGTYFSHCVSIPICENSELVVFSGPMINKWPPFQWTLRMEVMRRGATITN